MADYEWPAGLAPKEISLRLIDQTRSTNKSLSGFVQVADGITQRWGLSLEFNTIKRELILPYRALLASLRGRARSVRVPIFDPQFWPTDAEIVATISGTIGDRSATVDLSSVASPATKLKAGHYFNAGDDLHIVTAISWSGSTAAIDFEPALRSTKVAAAFLLRPYLTCRLVSDTAGEHSLEYGIRTAPTMELEELVL